MKRMDEMERTMSDKSLRYSWGFGVITLEVMNIYNQIQHNQIHWSLIILMGMMLIYRFGYIYQQYKKGDRSALSTIFWIILGVVLALLISFLIGR